MAEEALAELERVPAEDRDHEDVAQLRVYILMRARRWPEALAACESLRDGRPELNLGYIHGAFCLHELGRTAEAMALLQDALPRCCANRFIFTISGAITRCWGIRRKRKTVCR